MPEKYFVKALPPRQARIIQSVLEAALMAVDPRLAVRRALTIQGSRLQVAGQAYDLDSIRRIRLVGAGKAVLAMAQGVLDVLGKRVTDGVLIAKHLPASGHLLAPGIDIFQGGHPIPTMDSIMGTRAVEGLLSANEPDDLVICLISGGGSALMTLPDDRIRLDDLQQMTQLLLACGADIKEINVLRKHLDRVKGGGLARMAFPARIITLVLSDVIGSPVDVIASGPMVADPSTFTHALQIIRKYHLEPAVPPAVLSVLKRGEQGELPETVKPGDPVLEKVSVQVVGDNMLAATAGLEQAEREGFHPLLLTTYLQGEASQAGMVLASLLSQVDATGQPLPRPACIAAGGETTVTLRGNGLGGRNQELALGAAFLLSGLQNVALVTLGTDGEDGPTNAAGAIVDGNTIQLAKNQGLDPLVFLQNNDSYSFFNALGDHILTGPTGTNVNDLVFLFAF